MTASNSYRGLRVPDLHEISGHVSKSTPSVTAPRIKAPLPAHDFNQVTDLLTDFVGVRDGLRNFVAKDLGMSPTQTMDGRRDGALRHTQSGSQFRVGWGRSGVVGLKFFQTFKQRFVARLPVFVPQAVERLIEDGLGPAFVEERFRGRLVSRLDLVAFLLGERVQKDRRLAAAALLRPRLVALIGQEMVENREQERTEFALLMPKVGEVVFLQQPSEELLGQILGFFWAVALSSNVGVERSPVRAAEFLQRVGCSRRLGIARCQHDAPMGRGEPLSIMCRGISWPGVSHNLAAL